MRYRPSVFAIFAVAYGVGGPALAQDRVPMPTGAVHACRKLDAMAITQPVTVGFRITKDGKVVDPVVLETSGSPTADGEAIACVSDWSYTPAMRAGAPVEWAARVALRSEKSAYADHGLLRPGDAVPERGKLAFTNVTPDIAKAFRRLVTDAQSRCPELFPVRGFTLDRYHATNRVIVRRLADGTIETDISKSEGSATADKNARICAEHLVKSTDHADLPPTYTVEIEIAWRR